MGDEGGDGGDQAELRSDEGLGDPAGQFAILWVGEIRDLPEDVDHSSNGSQQAEQGCGGGGDGHEGKGLLQLDLYVDDGLVKDFLKNLVLLALVGLSRLAENLKGPAVSAGE